MALSVTRHFTRGFLLGLGLGSLFGYGVYTLHRHFGLPASFLIFDLGVGLFFGLLAGWCFALQCLIKAALRDLFRFFSTKVPWLADALASDWVNHLRDAVTLLTGRLQGVPRWLVQKLILAPLSNVTPFRETVAKVRAAWKKPAPPTPEELAFEAMGVMLRPLDLAFLAAYALLLVAALLAWTVPLFLGAWR